MTETFDITIVGAGIAGASLAWRIAPHRRVLLLEAENQPGFHSTGRSAAMFMESYGPPQARALTRASREFLERPPTGFCDTALVAPRGVLYVARAGEERLLDTTLQTLRATGSQVDRVRAAEVLRRVPVMRPEGLIDAIDEQGALDIDVHALHQGFLRGARRSGAVLWTDAELAEGAPRNGRWRLTLGDGRQVDSGVVVNAAGAWADAVASRCGLRARGLQAKRRSAFIFDAPAGIDTRDMQGWPTVGAVGDGWYFKPDAGRLLGSPANADPVDAHDVQPEELDIATGIARIEETTTMTIRRPLRTWAGLRTFAPDGELVIGFDPECAGFFWLAGQGGYGIQSAAGASLLAANLLLGQRLHGSLVHEGIDATCMAPQRLRP